MKTNEVICNCMQVSYYDIEDAIHGMSKLDDVGKER